MKKGEKWLKIKIWECVREMIKKYERQREEETIREGTSSKVSKAKEWQRKQTWKQKDSTRKINKYQ
jgi:hypothetical protein